MRDQTVQYVAVKLSFYSGVNNKTPPQEIKQAKRNLKSFLERNGK